MTYKKLFLPSFEESIQLNQFYEEFPALEALFKCPQDPYHHAEGDVGTHTQMVCNEMLCSQEYLQADEKERFVLFYSCLLHDIAKPLCTKQDENGKISSKGHSKAGEIDTRIALWKKGVDFELREKICSIIEYHQVPFHIFNSFKDPDKLVIELSWKAPLHLLCAVAKADMKGRFFERKQECLDDIALLEDLAKDLKCFDTPFQFPDPGTRLKYFQEGSFISPSHSFYYNTKSTVYVLCGLPASGKSTWTQNNKHLPRVSFDFAREELGLRHGQNDGKAVHQVIDNAKDYLRKGQDFIWDATHLSKQMRTKTLDLIHRYDGRSIIVYLEAPFEELLRRNQARDSSLSNKKLQELFLKWEVPRQMECHELQIFI